MDELLSIAEHEGIFTATYPLLPPLYGVYLNSGSNTAIGLSSYIDTEAERRCIMAEELGHHFTSAGICIPTKKEFYCFTDRTNITKAEYKALKWAATHLMPEHDLLDVIKEGLYEPWELAEHFNVTETFAIFRLRLFGSRNF